MRKQRKEEGITLVALVVTIIVLIILATVSINIVFNKNGIIKKAEKAKQIQANATVVEQEGMDQLLDEYSNIIAEPPAGGTKVEKPSSWTSSKVEAIADGNRGVIPIPEGFYYVGGDIGTGVVISDKAGDTMDATGVNMGNQFVWIPVANASALERTEFDENGKPIQGLDTTKYMEPYEEGYEGEVEEYNTMKQQVLKYGGFYIGRFEAGVNSTQLRKDGAEIVKEVVSKKGVAVYNYIPWGKENNDISEGAVYLAKNMYKTSESVVSTLCYSSQWDAMCRYIGDGQRTTQNKEEPELTGSDSSDISKNIYDLAGNCHEWMMEAHQRGRTLRGSHYNTIVPITHRAWYNVNYPLASATFRCVLYIK